MDKETLSNYGWIVICVMVLAVMIALATPFGNFIADAVKSTTQGLFDVNQGALDAAGIVIDNNGFANTDGGTQTPTKDPALNPDDGTTPVDGEIYTAGDYKYIYSATSNEWQTKGWAVELNEEVTDKNQTSYGPILESINGEPITLMDSTFSCCYSLITAPKIPSSVTNISCAFEECSSLVTAPVIPSSVTIMFNTFFRCPLTIAPEIPNGVTNMESAFLGCTSLTDDGLPNIPNSVTNMRYTFWGCNSLTDLSDYVLPNSVTIMDRTFYECESLKSAPVIPSSVIDMEDTFHGCPSLTGIVSVPCTAQTNYYTVAPSSSATLEKYHYEGCGH